MAYASLMVHMDLDASNDARLRIAGDLAGRFGAKVIGIAAADPKPPAYAAGFLPESLIAEDRARMTKTMADLEARFRAAVGPSASGLEWRQSFSMPTDYVAGEARAADLVITGTCQAGDIVDPLFVLDPSDLVMRAGRPVLVVPPGVEGFAPDRALVAWKETPEARRAVADALPLLAAARSVTVVEIPENEDSSAARAHVEDVVSWLGRHGITATGAVPPASGEPAAQLEALAREEGADLIVAGAYGHSRLREIILGGVTRRIVNRSTRCALLSH